MPIRTFALLFHKAHRDEPGIGIDRHWIEVRDKDRNLIAATSMVSPASTMAVDLGGGNVFVPHYPAGIH